MTPETKACHWWKDPDDGRRYFIPGCMGAAVYGKRGCTCPPVAKRRLTMRHVDPIEDYANVVKQWAAAKERIREQALEIRELKRSRQELIDDVTGSYLWCAMASRESVDAVRFETFDQVLAHGPGGFTWCVDEDKGRRSIVFRIPGEQDLRSIQVQLGEHDPEKHIWGWDGDEDKPTLKPSILAWDRHSSEGRVEVWHGFLTAGRFISC